MFIELLLVFCCGASLESSESQPAVRHAAREVCQFDIWQRKKKSSQIADGSDEEGKMSEAAGSLRFKVEPFHVSIDRLSSHSSKQICDYTHELDLFYIWLEGWGFCNTGMILVLFYPDPAKVADQPAGYRHNSNRIHLLMDFHGNIQF